MGVGRAVCRWGNCKGGDGRGYALGCRAKEEFVLECIPEPQETNSNSSEGSVSVNRGNAPFDCFVSPLTLNQTRHVLIRL